MKPRLACMCILALYTGGHSQGQCSMQYVGKTQPRGPAAVWTASLWPATSSHNNKNPQTINKSRMMSVYVKADDDKPVLQFHLILLEGAVCMK